MVKKIEIAFGLAGRWCRFFGWRFGDERLRFLRLF
jgi:hypothetical protein